MNTKELKHFLKEHLVPSKLYTIGKKKNGRICLTKAGDSWELFFMDSKKKVGLMLFPDENSACQSMKEELRKIMESIYEVTWVPAKI
ncbi:MAG: hypothetical protein E7301_10520 [Butyrivibrio sp.]|jgi:hypothetical protein|uniref:hypothetical protein n=1 Tax=Butyrivibrio sp. NC2002 TaxID=1410610 RepID=UPI0005686107|nr:hypothetical protein [Butyrivibrio sp. NC2002]MBE5860539.1 hypothetical protein [Butyrivibrio sp.]